MERTRFIKAGAGTEQSTVWSTSRGGENDTSDGSSGGEDEGSDLDDRDETQDWIVQHRAKLALARQRAGSDVSDLSTDSDMEAEGIIVPPRRPGQPRGRGRGGGKATKKSVKFGPDVADPVDAGADRQNTAPPGPPPPSEPPGVQAPLFRPQTLGGTPAVAVSLPPADEDFPFPASEVQGGEEAAVDQAPPAWMFQADAGNKKYLQKLEEPKKEENRTFRAKFLMNSYVLAKDAMQSFNFGPGEKKSKKTPIRPYNGKVVCSHCKRQQIEKPPRWWPKGRARRETMEWCKREVVDDQIPGQAGHAQTIQRLMLCPLHEEDLIERDPNWLDGTVLLSKTTVLRHCKEADSDRAAISSDGFERCLSAVGRVGRTLSTLPDQIPEGIPGWTRPLTMILMATIAILFAWILPAAQANSRYAPELSPGEERVTVDHAFLQPDVRAVVVELDYGTVSIVSGGSGHAAQFEISITASPGGAGSQPVEVALMPDVAGSGGVLHVTRAGTGAWAALSRAATAETTLAVEVRIPTSLSLAHQHALTIEVTIGRNRVLPTSMAEDGVGDGNDGKLAAPGRLLLPSGDRDGTGAAGLVASTAEANGITWVGTPNGGETSGGPELGTMWLKRVSLSTLDGKIEARQLRSQVVRVASSSGTISLQGATSNSVSVSSGSAANGGPVEVIGLTLTSQAPWRTSGPTAATSGGGSLHLWSLNAPLTRISLMNDDASPVGVGGTLELPYPLNESAFGGGGGSAATAASVDVTCGGGVVPGNTCELEVPIRLCGEYMGDAAAAATGVGAQASATALLAFGAGIAAPHESSTGVGSISDDTFASQRVVLPCDNAGQELKGWAQIRAHSSGATLRLLTRS